MTAYEHPEAFCLMEYQCKKCGGLEILWNSRDGVTPFVINCLICKDRMEHTNFANDVRAPKFDRELLTSSRYANMRIFVGLTKEKAREYAQHRLQYVREHDPSLPEENSVAYQAVLSRVAQDLYHDGEGVDVITAGEFLLNTMPTSKAKN